jgi:hypothetical protein
LIEKEQSEKWEIIDETIIKCIEKNDILELVEVIKEYNSVEIERMVFENLMSR